MASTNFPLGPPDSSGLIYVVNNAQCHAAQTTHNASSVEPVEKPQLMFWFDLRTNVMNVRTPDATAWMQLFRVRGNKIYPLQAGAELSPIVTLETGKQGYVYATGTGFEVQEIDSPDIPLFGVGHAGIVPGVTNQQSGLPAALRSDGSWKLGSAEIASRTFSGAKEYPMTVPAADRYCIAGRVKLSGGQQLMMQIGSGGSPKQLDYTSSAMRAGEDPDSETRGFLLWNNYSTIRSMVFSGILTRGSGNEWLWTGMAQNLGSQIVQAGDATSGTVTIPGSMNYIRVLAGGSPVGTFNNQNSIDEGWVTVHV